MVCPELAERVGVLLGLADDPGRGGDRGGFNEFLPDAVNTLPDQAGFRLPADSFPFCETRAPAALAATLRKGAARARE